MIRSYGNVLLSCLGTLVLIAAPVRAYEILLDIDLDDDPTTVNELTPQTSVLVKMILAPTTPGETIGHVEFGLGGSCRDCDLIHHYGTAHDLVEFIDPPQPWIQAAAFDSGWDYALCLSCPASVGYHLLLWFEPVGGGTITLDAPVFLAEFNVWVADPVPAGCQQPPSNLAAMPDQGVFWNYVQLGGPAIPNEASDWGAMKSLYR